MKKKPFTITIRKSLKEIIISFIAIIFSVFIWFYILVPNVPQAVVKLLDKVFIAYDYIDNKFGWYLLIVAIVKIFSNPRIDEYFSKGMVKNVPKSMFRQFWKTAPAQYVLVVYALSLSYSKRLPFEVSSITSENGIINTRTALSLIQTLFTLGIVSVELGPNYTIIIHDLNMNFQRIHQKINWYQRRKIKKNLMEFSESRKQIESLFDVYSKTLYY